jgi:catechol 2,3-dioxygenase-like lactoylglutathione lyase family enzyme
VIHSLRHFALGVPDLAVGADFYTTFGLNQREQSGRELFFRCDGRAHDEVVLIETGQNRKFHHIAFGADAKGLDRISNTLRERGIALEKPPSPDTLDGLWFRDSDGNLVNVHIASKAAKHNEAAPVVNYPGVTPRIDQRGCPRPSIAARPRRLGHMILFTPSVPRQLQFYCDVLGMKLSDTIVDEYGAFLRVAGESDHHVLGLLNSQAPGFHHASFEVGSIDEAELAAGRLKGKSFRHAWGPGRHAIGSNYFHYFRDPWNGMAEYFFDIDYITRDLDWKPVDWTKKDGMFLWSADGPPPPDFGRNYEID